MNSRTIDLNPKRWARVEQLFDKATDLPDAERDAFLAEECASDTELRGYIESLLDSDMGSDNAISDMIAGALHLLEPEISSDKAKDVSGDRIGPYRVVREIGSGGMGIVYLAERADEQFEQQVAIKLVRQRLVDPEIEARLVAERQILANLDHPNIARLLDGGTTPDGTPYLVMEHIDGIRIDSYCDKHHLKIDDRLELFRTICTAVHYAHQNLVVHRDIKPSNILVTSDGTPKLLDFGIAKLIDTSGTAMDGLTRAGVSLMTPENAAPEQVLGKPITTATDTYALGVLLYSLLTGYTPLQLSGLRQNEIAMMICEQVPERPSRRLAIERLRTNPTGDTIADPTIVAQNRSTTVERLQRRLRGDLDNILLAALRKEPERRYRSANQFAEDIRFYKQSMPIVARPDTWSYRTTKFVRRHVAGVVASFVLVSLLVAFGLVTTVQNKRIAEERDTAREISKFLEEIFMEPDPSRARGLDITAKEILNNGAKRIRQQLDGEPEVQSALMSTIGRVYYNLGDYNKSAEMQEESLNLRQYHLGDTHSDVAVSKNELAMSLTTQGDYERARNLLEEALAQNIENLGSVNPEVAGNLYNLSDLSLETGALDDAEKYGTQSVETYTQLGSTYSVELAEAKSTLARIFQVKGDLNQTEALLREAIDTLEGHAGPDHPHMAYYLQNLAVLLQSKGDDKVAEEMLHRSIETTRRILGNEHDLLGTTLVRLGILLQNRGDYDGAEEALRDGLEIHRKTLGVTHSLIGYDMSHLGALYHDKGNLAEAERMLRDALDVYSQSLGSSHQYVASALTELGAVLNSGDSPKEAQPLLEKALDIRHKDYPEDHPLVAGTNAVYADTLSRLGDHDRAEALLLASHEVLKDQDNRRSRRAKALLTQLYERTGRKQDADKYRGDIRRR